MGLLDAGASSNAQAHFGVLRHKPLTTLMFGPVLTSTTTQRQRWLQQAMALARRSASSADCFF
jgi:hypothetical protein